MIPRPEIVAFDRKLKIPDIIPILQRTPHARFPLYDKTLDHVIGMLRLKDIVASLLLQQHNKSLKHFSKEVLFVPESMLVTDLLVEMKKTGIHLAIVLDEYGGTEGLVTISDVTDEITGEMREGIAYQILNKPLKSLPDGSLEIDAKTPLEKVEQWMGRKIIHDNHDVHTIGGLAFELNGAVPDINDVVKYEDFDIHIIKADKRYIKVVRLTKKDRLVS